MRLSTNSEIGCSPSLTALSNCKIQDFMLKQILSKKGLEVGKVNNGQWWLHNVCRTKRIFRCRSEMSFLFQQETSYLLLWLLIQKMKSGAVC